jgi:hypothetical protein
MRTRTEAVGTTGAKRLLGLLGVLAFAVPAGLVVTAPAEAATTTLTEIGRPFAVAPLATPGQPTLTFAAAEVWSSAAIGDVTGNGEPNIVVGGGLSSQLRVYSTSGSLIRRVDVGGVDVAQRRGGIQASPALADLNGDRVADVTVATTSNVLTAYSFRAGNASALWRRKDAPIVPDGPNGMIATPAIGHISGDGVRDVVTGSWGQALGASSGTSGAQIPGWPKWLKDTIWSSPAIGDTDGNGVLDVVVGGDCEGNTIGTQPCGSVGGGYVWSFDRTGKEKWRYFLQGQTIWSSPALADLNGDGAQDVVVGTGGYWAEPAGRRITALNGKTGKVLWTSATPARVVGSPSLGDVTGDGRADVFVVTHGGYLLSISGATGTRRWSACITDSGDCGNTRIGTKTGVALADVDGDGAIEAITQGEQRLRVYDARTGTLEASPKTSYAGSVRAPANAPSVAEVDGETWIVQPVHGVRNGVHELVVTAWRTGKPLGQAPWPTFKGGYARTGAAALPPVDVEQTQAFVRELYRDFLGRNPSASELSTWTARFQRRQVTRQDMTTSLSRSDEWVSAVITRFYRDTLGREPDAAGLAMWVRKAKDGTPMATIAASFYASTEYYRTTGKSNDEVWVKDLYRKLLLREPDQAGVDGWVRALRSGTSRSSVAYSFYQSRESLGVRIDRLYQELLGRPVEPGGVTSWAELVRTRGDLVLAASLAASKEYYLKAEY